MGTGIAPAMTGNKKEKIMNLVEKAKAAATAVDKSVMSVVDKVRADVSKVEVKALGFFAEVKLVLAGLFIKMAISLLGGQDKLQEFLVKKG